MRHEHAKERGNPDVASSDESLVLLARAGDRGAFAELWQRHARSGLRVARQFTSSVDADDLVSEAYARIYQRVLAGGGPDGAFRPYLYTTIRNLASRWGSDRRDVNVDDIGEFEDPKAADDPATVALDRTLTVRAFRTLPERWQAVLWYTEVEGMDPHEVAPILGLTANGVAALSYRAREGLRKAWLQAHVSDATASGECQWSIARLGDYARNGLTARERARVTGHLRNCPRCAIISEEVDEVGSRLALVLLPLLLGGIAGGGFLASLSASTSAVAASLAPALPPAFAATTAVLAAPTVAAGLSASAIAAPLIAGLAAAMVVSSGLAVSHAAPPAPPPVSTSITQPHHRGAAFASAAVPSTPTEAPAAAPAADRLPPVAGALGSAVTGTLAGAGTAVDGLVKDLANPINSVIPGLSVETGVVAKYVAPATVVGAVRALDLSGTGIPGATVSLQAAGVVNATTTVTAQGTWAIHVTELPASALGLQVRQIVLSVLGIHLDSPLRVLSNNLGVAIEVLGT